MLKVNRFSINNLEHLALTMREIDKVFFQREVDTRYGINRSKEELDQTLDKLESLIDEMCENINIEYEDIDVL